MRCPSCRHRGTLSRRGEGEGEGERGEATRGERAERGEPTQPPPCRNEPRRRFERGRSRVMPDSLQARARSRATKPFEELHMADPQFPPINVTGTGKLYARLHT